MSGVLEYRDDDERGRGWCPKCGREVRDVNLGGSGYCEEHGLVFVNWEPPPEEEDPD